MFHRSEYKLIKSRIEEPRKFIQVIMGPRQVGKSTVVKQVVKDISIPYLFYAADDVPATNKSWISNCWDAARAILNNSGAESIVLIIDEIQKIDRWSEAVKKEWDSDNFHDRNIKVVLLGSSRVLLEKGLSDSLAGRYEEIRMTHWTYPEMRDCFGLSLEQYIYYGGYPGAASLINDEDRFRDYIQAAIVDATINKDILVDTPINKPALLRQTFELGAAYSGSLLSLTKMLGSLQDAGNTSTLASYINLLGQSGLLTGLQKFSIDNARRKASIPKLQVFNNALKTIFSPHSFQRALLNRQAWGNILESSVGAFLINAAFSKRLDLYYWRDRDLEVDFILRKKESLIAIEVKCNSEKRTEGLEKFKELYSPKEAFIVGDGGIPVENFLSMDINRLFE